MTRGIHHFHHPRPSSRSNHRNKRALTTPTASSPTGSAKLLKLRANRDMAASAPASWIAKMNAIQFQGFRKASLPYLPPGFDETAMVDGMFSSLRAGRKKFLMTFWGGLRQPFRSGFSRPEA